VSSSASGKARAELLTYFQNEVLKMDRVRHSFHMRGGDLVDCVDDASTGPALAPPTQKPPSTLDVNPEVVAAIFADGSLDTDGKKRACPAGTGARVRPSFSMFDGVSSLAEYRDRLRAAHHLPGPQTDEPGHDHAVAAQYGANAGVSADISFHRPYIERP
jgi:hypothetical protein